jgi:glucose/arabinose dehydrogenase
MSRLLIIEIQKGPTHAEQSETLVAVALITSAFGLSFAGAQQKVAREETPKDILTQNFLAQHEIGRRFRIDPAELPAPKTGAIVTNRALTVPYNGQTLQVPPDFTATPFATGLINPRRLLVLPNGDVLVAEQSAGYLTLLRDDGTGKATWINRHVEDLNKPYGLAWQNDRVLVADQDGIWIVPHVLGALRAGRPENKRADEVPPDERKPTPGAYGAKLITKKGVFGIVQGHQNRDLVVDPKTGALFVGVGSSGNLGVEPEPKATIQRFNADGSSQTTFASGTRNPTALAFHPQSGDLYALVQERDGLGDLLAIRLSDPGSGRRFLRMALCVYRQESAARLREPRPRQGAGYDHSRPAVRSTFIGA